ncbi:GNAT family N-acetyltransferase [Streptomyces sp. NBC_01318]|uniref:GNAT family N-acetyltransferase n=1 Tax=Streptomyces sp. NBC_01318 TaxID=2903823 RepID=UPI002E1619AD|nr:GNAT family N-acetyltransferase [Streptomyces sp. NBC_01318]
MRFHWSWIEPVMPVPYVPTLGPVHPDDPVPDLLAAVVETAGTGRFLPYDKDRRWSDTKTERVLTDAIEHDRRQTLIPTLAERGAGTVKVHVYGAAPDGLSAGADLARKLAAVHGAAKARVVWFLGPNQPETYADGVSTRIQVKDFRTGPGKAPAAPVQKYKQLPEEVRADFAAFAEQMAADGFAFLYEQMQAGTVGPVLTVLHGDHVAGASGPMETMTDPSGAARLLPQYFGVLPQHRGHGYGRALWRAAMHWGHQHGAAYQLLQTEVGGASDRLCATEGLTSLGFVNQTDV